VFMRARFELLIARGALHLAQGAMQWSHAHLLKCASARDPHC
jgi:hypothetical protein